jgi:divalent metal cation (Fe/Co/Zn/Cd) transporter
LVACFILFAGYRAAKETIEPLLGMRPEKELVDELESLILSHKPIIGVHDLILHDYGPGRRYLSLHAEVPMDEDILFVHDVIDDVEIEIFNRYGIETVIHMDPINTRDPRLNEIKSAVLEVLTQFNENLKAHDFRIVPGPTHTNVVFDIAVPADCKTDADVLKLAASTAVTAQNPQYRCVIRIDRDYS